MDEKDKDKEKATNFVKEIVEAENKELKTTIEKYETQMEELTEKLEKIEKLPALSVQVVEDKTLQKGGFNTFGEFCMSVLNSTKANAMDTEMQEWAKRASEDPSVIKTVGDPSSNVSILADGGYLIPTEFSTSLLTTGLERADLVGKCRAFPISTNSLKIPYIKGFDHSSGIYFGGIQLYWRKELEQFTATKPEFGQLQLNLHKLTGLHFSSDEMIDDSPISIGPMIESMFPETFAQKSDNFIINGTGADQPLGILNSPAIIEVPIETGQAAATIVSENIDKMIARAYKAGGPLVWLVNHDCYPQLVKLERAIGTGGALANLFNPNNNTLVGRPVIFTEHCQTLGTVGDILLVDLLQYLIVTKAGAGLKMDTSMHLKFDFDQMTWRFIYRVDGQGWWSSDIKPRYSADTISPFVALAVRA